MSGIEHILDFSSSAAMLRSRNALLVVERADAPEQTVPLAEIAAVVLAHPAMVCTRGHWRVWRRRERWW